jgi:hypothetical protein
LRLAWINGIYQGTGLRTFLWQQPAGNSLYSEMNNSNFHTQNNEAQYFLQPSNNKSTMQLFANAGVIGVLWTEGQYSNQSGPTTYDCRTAANSAPINGNYLVTTRGECDAGLIATWTAIYHAHPLSLN